MLINDRCYEMSDTKNMMNEIPMDMSMCCPVPTPIVCPPVIECPQERCCHRQIVHEVPHLIPINTRIINHHIYRHTYMPQYTCTEENEVSNVYEKNCMY